MNIKGFKIICEEYNSEDIDFEYTPGWETEYTYFPAEVTLTCKKCKASYDMVNEIYLPPYNPYVK